MRATVSLIPITAVPFDPAWSHVGGFQACVRVCVIGSACGYHVAGVLCAWGFGWGFSAEEMKAAAKGLRRQGEQFSEDLECHVDQGLCGKDEATSAVHLIGRLLHAKRMCVGEGGGDWHVCCPHFLVSVCLQLH